MLVTLLMEIFNFVAVLSIFGAVVLCLFGS